MTTLYTQSHRQRLFVFGARCDLLYRHTPSVYSILVRFLRGGILVRADVWHTDHVILPRSHPFFTNVFLCHVFKHTCTFFP